MDSTISRPYPLGATINSNGCNFAIHAPDCHELFLVLFSENGQKTRHKIVDEYCGVKHIFIKDIAAGQKYGFETEICGDAILISDPYAKALDKALSYEPPYSADKSWGMPRCVVVNDDFDWQDSQHPLIPREESILFETHVKGLTKLNQEVPVEHRGSYLGLVSPAMLQFYKAQKINTLQLLPVAACMHEPHLLEMGMVNYWGYNPYLFMAPDPRYAQNDAVIELKTVIRELHKNGIEVILDVVYNHTAEGGEGGPTFNLKALDQHYYIKHGHHFANFTGCGNTVDVDYQPSMRLIMDTLRYWVQEFKVDGFRFDLAATLGRNGDNFNPQAAFFKAVSQDPVLKQTKLIAEPWDIGPNGYQVGSFPDEWNECNDKFRDIARSFWRGDQGFLKEFATRIMGSRDIYSASRWPQRLPVNYITYHDGYTLQDLVSYKNKHNEANGEHNRDGHGDNRSENYGVEGETADVKIKAIREKQKRNCLASLLFSFSIPHILTADTLSHTQKGNNNAYCQDSELSWLNWDLSERKQQFSDWVANMIAAREEHMVPFIKAFSGKTRNNNRVHWRRPDGHAMEIDDWNQLRSVALHLGIDQDGDEMLYFINQSGTPARFKMPTDDIENWNVVCNTENHLVNLENVGRDLLLEPSSMVILKHTVNSK